MVPVSSHLPWVPYHQGRDQTSTQKDPRHTQHAVPHHTKSCAPFRGNGQFYRDLFPKRAETFAPLTDLCRQKKKIIWESQQEEAFQKMKSILAQEARLTYPEFDKPFVIYTDTSDIRSVASSRRMKTPWDSSARS
jgi:hypothetical protein